MSTSGSHPRHWHVRVTVAGESLEPLLVRSALRRLSEERPFLESMNFTGSSAQVEFWDEGESMLDVASLALRFWNEHRDSAGLPKWEVVGLEVMEKTVKAAGGGGRTVEPSMRVPAPFTF
ncbi:MAG TPA: hypothetical protein VFK34_05575 [Marmoricola sp.]|nr:hypothetical protein [Marmoricola sp.]